MLEPRAVVALRGRAGWCRQGAEVLAAAHSGYRRIGVMVTPVSSWTVAARAIRGPRVVISSVSRAQLRVMLRVMLWEAQFGELAGIKLLLGRSLSRQLHRQDRHFGGHLSCIS
ncbi:hypothetical protein H113_06641 [Trichophyton rubrum MR1459]|uniref:Uncharacterized protein n=1 Tax=Trichophyton rubrum (strain ATCC MYA-4607 / CBS 118892) TaxID=559305 RepID=A0A080WRF2_TRIRC|nr:uncharacterized protein TERG_11780 [Trichophyton rubrum CBS 118892]EZF92592.1 hypothetical protein H113_06641 [Trichophyton rubrum MR1459]EZG02902.1 hypothetical protein H106_06437 [Trichophyton rubrum CBS 735.88]KFL60728.1 hypothetical protein TERG_11780 [Trichophyton rubrum CBS 118892]